MAGIVYTAAPHMHVGNVPRHSVTSYPGPARCPKA